MNRREVFLTSSLLAVLACGAFLLRAIGVEAVGYNMDEVEKAVAAASYLNGHFFVDMEHPMLFKSILAAGFRIFGPGEYTARLVVSLLGALTVPVVFLAARALFSVRTGLVAAALFTVSPFAVAVNHTVKEDTLYMLFWLVALLPLLGGSRSGVGGVYQAAVALGLAWASKFNAPFLMLLMAAALVILGDRWTARHGSITAGRALSLSAAAMLAFVLANPLVLSGEYWSFLTESPVASAAGFEAVEPERVRTGFGLYLNVSYAAYLPLKATLPVAGGVLYGILRGVAAGSRSVYFLLFWTGAMLCYLVFPSLQVRYLYMVWPALTILAAYGLVRLADDLPFSGSRATAVLTAAAIAAGASPCLQLAPYQAVFANSLARIGRASPVLLLDNDLYAAGTERRLAEHINATAPPGSTVGAVLPLNPTAPVNVYEFYGRPDLSFADINELYGEHLPEAARNIDFFAVPRYKRHHVSPELQSYLDGSFVRSRTVRIAGIPAGSVYRRTGVRPALTLPAAGRE